jgi:hypothetical protein
MHSSFAAMSNHLLSHYPSQSPLHGASSALGMSGGQPLTPSQCMALSALLQSAPQRQDPYYGHGLLASGYNPAMLGLLQPYPPSFNAAAAAAAAAGGHMPGSGGGGSAEGGGDWSRLHSGGC